MTFRRNWSFLLWAIWLNLRVSSDVAAGAPRYPQKKRMGPSPRTELSTSPNRVRYAVATALVPRLEGSAPAESPDHLRVLDDFFRRQTRAKRLGLHIAFVAFEYGPVVILGKFRRFSKLSEEDREDYFGRWYSSRFYLVRQLSMLIKTVGLLGWSGHPQTRYKITGKADKVISTTTT